MKNRGYAAGCRFNKVETEKSLEAEQKELEVKQFKCLPTKYNMNDFLFEVGNS